MVYEIPLKYFQLLKMFLNDSYAASNLVLNYLLIPGVLDKKKSQFFIYLNGESTIEQRVNAHSFPFLNMSDLLFLLKYSATLWSANSFKNIEK